MTTGSRKIFKYNMTASLATPEWRYFEADESNQELIIAPGGAYDDGGESLFDFKPSDDGVVIQPLPKKGRTFRPRIAKYSALGGLSNKFIKLSAEEMLNDMFNSNTANINTSFVDPINGETYTLVDVFPQFIKRPFAQDTGQTDGDNT